MSSEKSTEITLIFVAVIHNVLSAKNKNLNLHNNTDLDEVAHIN